MFPLQQGMESLHACPETLQLGSKSAVKKDSYAAWIASVTQLPMLPMSMAIASVGGMVQIDKKSNRTQANVGIVGASFNGTQKSPVSDRWPAAY